MAVSDIATTTLSSKGQVVIPEEIRARLGLETGAQLVVLAEKDVVIFKLLRTPDKAQFSSLIQKARLAAKKAGMRPGDVATAIGKVRARK